MTGGFDLGAFDNNQKLNFVNQTIYPPKTANAICPLDYFNEQNKSQAFSIFKRSGEPICGSVMQDMPNTPQGNWFYGDTTDYNTYSNWNSHLSVVHDNFNTQIGVIGIAGTITTPKVLMFTPQTNGEINREPSSIDEGNTIYCYQSEQTLADFKYVTGSLLMQLVNATTLKVEWRENNCSGGNYNFSTNAKEYSR